MEYSTFLLDNGLKVILHQDKNTPLVSVNVLYNVGARDEEPNKTGFAHLFEHLMFGGSKHIPNYDQPVEQAGGENNAFTNNDITNYYLTLPKQFLETALWLESDRMQYLNISQKALDVQKGVVSEEFKQRYLNQPYGDVWLLLRPLAYTTHPYQWSTIGKDLSHIENARLEDVHAFFKKFYNPNNANLTIAGDIEINQTFELVKKWFGTIPAGEPYYRKLQAEPEQKEARQQTVYRNVPANAIYKAYHMCDRCNEEYYVFDMISDILSSGKSSRLYNELVKRQKLFSEISAFITGDAGNGLFVICGKLLDNVSVEKAEQAMVDELEKLKHSKIEEDELQKVKNQMEVSSVFSQYKVLDRAMNLAYYDWLGNINLINTELSNYRQISSKNIMDVAEKAFHSEKCSTLYYLKTS